MMRYADLTREQIGSIIDDYTNGNLTIQELQNKYSITKGIIYSIQRKHNLKPRHSIIKKTRKCRHCGSTINIPEARFCYNCGKKILTSKEIILEELDFLEESFNLIKSSSNRDKMIQAINDTKHYILTGEVED